MDPIGFYERCHEKVGCDKRTIRRDLTHPFLSMEMFSPSFYLAAV